LGEAWGKIAAFLRSGYGITASIAGFLLALYYGPRTMLETWDWYINRFFDEPVLDVLRHQAMVRPADRPRPLEPLSIGELAKKLDRTQRSIAKSIKRLTRTGKIEFYFGGYRFKE